MIARFAVIVGILEKRMVIIFKTKNYNYELSVHLPNTNWWGIMTLIISSAIMIKILAFHFFYLGDFNTFLTYHAICFMIFFFKGFISFYKSHRLLDIDRRIF